MSGTKPTRNRRSQGRPRRAPSLYLHCGYHRTGSSCLQTVFALNREALRWAGWGLAITTSTTGNHGRTASGSDALRLPRVAYRHVRHAASRCAAACAAGFGTQCRLLHPTEPALRRVRWISLTRVRSWTQFERWSERRSGYVLGGPWDLEHVVGFDVCSERSRTYRSALEMVAEGRAYTHTDQFLHLVEVAENGRWHPELAMRGSTLERVHAYFRALERTFEDIRAKGLGTQASLEGPHARLEDEIQVLVDRHDTFVRARGGNHRFAIAQVLAEPSIPVHVRGVPRRWAKERHERLGGPLCLAIARGLDDICVRPPPQAGP